MSVKRAAWRHRLEFLGSRLRAVGQLVIVEHSAHSEYRLRALHLSDGTIAWDYGEHVDNFYAVDDRVYAGGPRARCIGADGTVLAERAFEGRASVNLPAATGPVYAADAKIMGLSARDLSTQWEWADPDEEWTAHGLIMCRQTTDGRLESRTLPSMELVADVQPSVSLPLSALHAHHGHIWCHFGLTKGGRTGIDVRTGEVVWTAPEPAGYGLVVLDGTAAYSAREGVSAYDLATGRRIWANKLPNVGLPPHVEGGRLYVATTDGSVQVMDAITGSILAVHRFEYQDSGLGFEPSPVVPFGENRIVIGTRREIICLETP